MTMAEIIEAEGKPRADGPYCDTCGEEHWYNFFVPDDVWEKIAPLDVPGGGALCVRCIDKRCVELGIKTTGRFHYVGKALLCECGWPEGHTGACVAPSNPAVTERGEQQK